MESLRNFVQHHGLPVAQIVLPSEREDLPGGSGVHSWIRVFLRLEDLRGDRNFRKKTFAELEAIGRKTVDITPLVREYVEGLSHGHSAVRSATANDVERWEGICNSTLTRYELASAHETTRVVAYKLDCESITDKVVVFREGIDRLKWLRRKRLPTHASQRYVSNRASTRH